MLHQGRRLWAGLSGPLPHGRLGTGERGSATLTGLALFFSHSRNCFVSSSVQSLVEEPCPRPLPPPLPSVLMQEHRPACSQHRLGTRPSACPLPAGPSRCTGQPAQTPEPPGPRPSHREGAGRTHSLPLGKQWGWGVRSPSCSPSSGSQFPKLCSEELNSIISKDTPSFESSRINRKRHSLPSLCPQGDQTQPRGCLQARALPPLCL